MQGHRLLQLKNPWSHLRWKVCTSPYQSQLFVECFCKQNVGKISTPDWLRQRHPNFDCWDQTSIAFSPLNALCRKRLVYPIFKQSQYFLIVILQGKFSEMDSTSWTPELQRALNYDRKSAIQIDNGKNVVHCMSWSVPLSPPLRASGSSPYPSLLWLKLTNNYYCYSVWLGSNMAQVNMYLDSQGW